MQGTPKSIEGHRFKVLLLFLLLYILGSPFLSPFPSLATLAHLSLSFVVLVALYTMGKRQHQRSIGILLLLPLLSFYWLGILNIISFGKATAYLLFAFYYGLLIYSFSFQILHTRRVNTNVLLATFCLYLVIGLFWGVLYALLNEVIPGVYSGNLISGEIDSIHHFNYFSFVTLTTLGYGDITPQTAGAASLCQMEAITGQFFTAVVVAWLVGVHVSNSQENRKKEVKKLSDSHS